ncbi:hypothetical protein [Sorangium sp. So ce362]|uniref:hypothetical protein n=1 Tax=Sorangium sp. So ce362 TaxID=3133303 RepID=UPI003F611D7F
MISVLALDRNDGWVFAREGERILLLRPPYRLSDAITVSEVVVQRAVTQYAYVACNRDFPAWTDVVAFAREEVAQSRKAEGRTLPEEGVGRALLRNAPASTIERFLERIRSELLPRSEFNAAERILAALQIESLRLRESPELSRRVAELLADVLKRREERIARLIRKEETFPRLARRGRLDISMQYGQQVARAGSMFAR